MLSGRHANPIYPAPENDWPDRRVDRMIIRAQVLSCVGVEASAAMAAPNTSRAGGADKAGWRSGWTDKRKWLTFCSDDPRCE